MKPKLVLVVFVGLVFFFAVPDVGVSAPIAGQGALFLRSDANSDGEVTIADPVFTLGFLFGGGPAPVCMDGADANDDGAVDLSDPVRTLDYLFRGGSLPEPYPEAGHDNTADHLDCKGGIKQEVPFEVISMECMDCVTRGGELEAVIPTEEEYEQLYYRRFQKPLDDYWNENYEDVKRRIREKYPEISEDELERRVRDSFYSVYPFKCKRNCRHPGIDFSRYTLLGQDANASGCVAPKYSIEVTMDEQGLTCTYKLTIRQYGACEMAIMANKWILVPKIPPGYTVRFRKEYLREDLPEASGH